jgi:hypothetical protein
MLTVFTLIVWLLLGAHKIELDFNPQLIAFVIAIVVDLFINRGVVFKKTV